MSSLSCTTAFTRPGTPFTYVVYNNIHVHVSLSKGHLGSRRKAFKINLKDTGFIFPMTIVIVLSIFHMHAQNEFRRVLEMKSPSVFNSLVLLLFEN